MVKRILKVSLFGGWTHSTLDTTAQLEWKQVIIVVRDGAAVTCQHGRLSHGQDRASF